MTADKMEHRESTDQRDSTVGKRKRDENPPNETSSKRHVRFADQKREDSAGTAAKEKCTSEAGKGSSTKMVQCVYCMITYPSSCVRASSPCIDRLCRVKNGCTSKVRAGEIPVYVRDKQFSIFNTDIGAVKCRINGFERLNNGKPDYSKPHYTAVSNNLQILDEEDGGSSYLHQGLNSNQLVHDGSGDERVERDEPEHNESPVNKNKDHRGILRNISSDGRSSHGVKKLPTSTEGISSPEDLVVENVFDLKRGRADLNSDRDGYFMHRVAHSRRSNDVELELDPRLQLQIASLQAYVERLAKQMDRETERNRVIEAAIAGLFDEKKELLRMITDAESFFARMGRVMKSFYRGIGSNEGDK